VNPERTSMKVRIGEQTVRTETEQTLKDRGQTAKIGQTAITGGQDHSATEEKGQKHGQIQTLLKPEV
jgi:hypothetical protein